MSKSLKIFLGVLALISVSFSALYYFNLLPFLKKGTTTTGNNNLINQTVNENRSIAIPTQTNISNDCVILDKENCALGKPIYENNQLVAIGFKLPAGSKVYSPFKGQVEKNTAFQLNGKGYPSIELMDISKDDWGLSPTRTYFSIVGYFQNEIPDETLQIEGKAQVVEVSGMTIDSTLGDYNLILNFMKYNLEKNEWTNDINLLKQYFPNI